MTHQHITNNQNKNVMHQPIIFPGGFSVLMAVYRKDDHQLFRKAIASVFDNSLQPSEFILVIDGPISETLKNQIDTYSNQWGFKPLQLTESVGLAKALNAGLKVAKTEWIVRADADDVNLVNRFESIAKALNKNDLDVVGSAILEVEKSGAPIAVRAPPSFHDEILKFAKHRNPFNHMSIAFRRPLALECNGYPNIYLKEDYALWAMMLAKGARTHNLPEVLVHATAGLDMYKRRGGLRYAFAEINLQKHLVKYRLKGIPSALFDGLLRSVIFLLPSSIRGWIYKNKLRNTWTINK